MSETATLQTPSSPASTSPAPAAETRTAPAPSPSPRTEPAATGSDRPTTDNPTATPATPPAISRKDRLRQIEATGKAIGNPPRPAEPAPFAPKAAPPAPAAKEPSAPEPVSTSADDGATITRKMVDEHGVEKDVIVTLQEATEAIIRDGYGADFIRNMTNKKILEVGSRRMREQRRQDAFGAQAAQWRRVAEGAGKPPAQAASPAPATADGKAQAAQTQAPAAISSPTAPSDQSSPSASSQIAEELEVLRQAAGDEVSTAMSRILSKMQASNSPSDLQTQFNQKLQEVQQQHQQQMENVVNLQVAKEFRSAREKLKEQYPQLKDDTQFDRFKKRAEVFAKSGEWENPLDAFDEICSQAAQSLFGSQQAETHALKLEEARRRQKQGQPARIEETQANAAPQSMTRKDRLRAIENVGRTQGLDAAREYARSVTATSG